MRFASPHLLAGTALCAALLAALPASATPVLINGGFEAPFATGWNLDEQLGGGGSFFLQAGTTSPLGAFTVAAPSQGNWAAMSDSDGNPGAHVLYQDFTASGSSVRLKFDLYLSNRATDLDGNLLFVSPSALDFNGVLNQQARVDILSVNPNPFDTTSVLLNLIQTMPGDAPPDGYVRYDIDVSALMLAQAGQTLRLRFAEVDNLGEFQMGVDNVRFEATGNPVPEPGGWALAGLALAALALSTTVGRRRRAAAVLAMAAGLGSAAQADTLPPVMLDPSLQVSTALASGLSQPIGMVFIGTNDYLVLEKASGQVKRVINGVLQPVPVLDLAVNSNSERGLLSMALGPNFPADPSVYVFWTESTSGVDSSVVSDVPLLGNRVDRFVWNGSSLGFVGNLLHLRARQTDNIVVPGQAATSANPAERGNHNGGTLRFGPDGKLYVFMGDQGRRGWMQNLPNGPFLQAPLLDDVFGGPVPDNAHLAGVVLRLNPDGTAPADNPFFATGAAFGGEVGANVQKLYSYGHRNGFGMAFDPISGWLWLTENADDAYAEINRVAPGMNGGWIQFAGPISRVRDWRTIEATQFNLSLQQLRYPPTRAAYTPTAASGRLFMLPGAFYKDPELSARYEIGPSGAAFVQGDGLGAAYNGTFWFGSSRAFQQVAGNGGSLYRLRLSADRLSVDTSADPRLADKVIDNLFSATKFNGNETETIKIGAYFGIVTDIRQAPDGSLYVVSLTDNAIYRISKAP